MKDTLTVEEFEAILFEIYKRGYEDGVADERFCVSSTMEAQFQLHLRNLKLKTK
jgi:hypothetical protein